MYFKIIRCKCGKSMGNLTSHISSYLLVTVFKSNSSRCLTLALRTVPGEGRWWQRWRSVFDRNKIQLRGTKKRYASLWLFSAKCRRSTNLGVGLVAFITGISSSESSMITWRRSNGTERNYALRLWSLQEYFPSDRWALELSCTRTCLNVFMIIFDLISRLSF